MPRWRIARLAAAGRYYHATVLVPRDINVAGSLNALDAEWCGVRQAPGGGPPLGEAQRYALHLQKRFGEGAECGASYSRLAAGHYPLDLGALSLLTSEALPANLDELLEWNNGWERAAGSADRWHLVVIGTEVGR